MQDDNTSNRGLASANAATRKRVASMGGHAQPREAKVRAGRKGGKAGRRSS